MVKLKIIIFFTIKSRKKIKIKAMKIKLKNIISSIELFHEIKNHKNFYKRAKDKN
jgi:hypothetical protein